MADQIHQIRECENCHAAMTPMGKLPAMGAKPLIKVFRCHECDHIGWDVIASKPVGTEMIAGSR
jgi:hypothetical protein